MSVHLHAMPISMKVDCENMHMYLYVDVHLCTVSNKMWITACLLRLAKRMERGWGLRGGRCKCYVSFLACS